MDEQVLSRKTPLPLLEDECGPRPHFLEQRFPHILQRVTVLWGKPQLDSYLHGLLGPIRPGVSGFPKEALAEITPACRITTALEGATFQI